MTATAPPADPPPPVHAYSILLEVRDVAVRVLWNDWPVVDRDTSGQDTVLLNPFVIAEKNVLRVQVGPIQEPAAHWVYLDLYRQEPDSDEKKRIFSCRWTPFVGGFTREGYLEVARHEIHVRRAFGRWRWEDARLFRVEDEAAARDKVVALHRALQGRDIDTFIALSAIKLEELARATGRHLEVVKAVQRELLGQYFADTTNTLRPLDPGDLVFHSGAGGRLVAVRRSDGTAPLSLWIGAGAATLPVVLSSLDSGFELVR